MNELVACCAGPDGRDAHPTCWRCMRYEHVFGMWEKQPAFAFEERVCGCCGHAESRVLPLGEEKV